MTESYAVNHQDGAYGQEYSPPTDTQFDSINKSIITTTITTQVK